MITSGWVCVRVSVRVRLIKNWLFHLCGFDSHYCIGKNIYTFYCSVYILRFSRSIQNNRIHLILLLECTCSCCCCCYCVFVCVFVYVYVCLCSIVVGCSVCLVSLLIYYGRIWVALSYLFPSFLCLSYVCGCCCCVVCIYLFISDCAGMRTISAVVNRKRSIALRLVVRK